MLPMSSAFRIKRTTAVRPHPIGEQAPSKQKFRPLTDAQIAANNERARAAQARKELAAIRAQEPVSERDHRLQLLLGLAREPGLSQPEFLARWRAYKQLREATAERSAARS